MGKSDDTVVEMGGFPTAMQGAQAEREAWRGMAANGKLAVTTHAALPREAAAIASQPVRWVWKYRSSGRQLKCMQRTSVWKGEMNGLRGARQYGRVLVLGKGPLAESLVHQLQQEASPYHLVGYLCKQEKINGSVLSSEEHEPSERLDEIASREGVQCIVVAMSERRGGLPVDQLLACRLQGIRIEDGVAFYEKVGKKIPLAGLNPSYLIFNGGFRWPSRAAKRSLDLLLSIVGFLLTSPLFVVLPILIKLTSPGPVFYRQERIGLNGRRFMILKFRSMSEDAELPGQAMWAKERDPRITAIGRFMRQFRIDELPQMLNVLKGDMSFVGPRPERPEFIAALCREIPYYALRLSVKPGITGWAQVMFRYGATVEDAAEKLQYDLYYIKHMSLALDSRIVLKTIRTVLFKSGAR